MKDKFRKSLIKKSFLHFMLILTGCVFLSVDVRGDDSENVVEINKDSYVFAITEPRSDLYDFSKSFTFNGNTYNGLYNSRLKNSETNLELSLNDLGKDGNPYVIMELTPSASISFFRQQIGDMGFYDMTPAEIKAVELTDSEKLTVRMQAIQYYVYKYNEEHRGEFGFNEYKFVDAINNRGDKTFESVLDEWEGIVSSKITTEEAFEIFLNSRYEYALNYKIDYLKSERYYKAINAGQYSYNYNYITQYAVDNGEFVTNSGSSAKDTKEVKTPSTTYNTNANYGEYAVTTSILNPMAVSPLALDAPGGGRVGLTTPANTFAKACFDLAFYREKNSAGEDVDLDKDGDIFEPYVDDYIFTGWYISVNDELVSIDSLDEDYDLSTVTDLYTKWSVRYYEEENYVELLTSGEDGDNAVVEFGSGGYKVHLPYEIASNRLNVIEDDSATDSLGNHNVRNQLTMCLAENADVLVTWSNDNKNYYTVNKDYVVEASSWDFDFAKKTYGSVADLRKVAPKLMADTDYRVLTYDIDKSGGVVTYKPFDVQIITITPEELNKMVYYDYYLDGKASADSGYMQSDYLSTFLNNIDLFFFSNGGRSDYCKDGDNVFYNYTLDMLSSYSVTLDIDPLKAPTLFKYNADGTLVYDKDNVITNMTFTGSSWKDMEWQVVDKIFHRVMDMDTKHQMRRASIIVDESMSDKVAGLCGAANVVGTSGSENNLCKLLQMFFVFKDPTLMYDMYVNPDYVSSYNFSKVTGVKREEVERDSYFTGSLYGAVSWNPNLFFPYEMIKATDNSYYNHALAVLDGDIFGQYSPFNSKFGADLWESVGLSSYSNYKGIANPFIYTYNGDTSLTSSFLSYTISESDHVTNQNTNTKAAFDYFREYKPSEIGSNGNLSTKSAIKFMVDIARDMDSDFRNKSIVIINASDDPASISSGGEVLKVDRVYKDDYSNSNTVDVEFRYTAAGTSGIFVVEYLLANNFINLDNDDRLGAFYYNSNTSKESTSAVHWHRIVETEIESKDYTFVSDKFVTRLINDVTTQYTSSADGYVSGTILTTRDYVTNPAKSANIITKYASKGSTVTRFFPEGANSESALGTITSVNDQYVFDALFKPSDSTGNYKPYYVIAVKQYADETAYNNGLPPESITLKNVTVEKMKYFFRLD